MSDRKNVVQEMTLGAALAVIRNEKDVSFVSVRVSRKDQKRLRRLRERRDFFNGNPEEGKQLLNSLKKNSCAGEQSELSGTADYFVVHLLVDSNSQDKQPCDRLARHLNQCYYCFEVYSDVVRDFYYTLKGKLPGKSNLDYLQDLLE